MKAAQRSLCIAHVKFSTLWAELNFELNKDIWHFCASCLLLSMQIVTKLLYTYRWWFCGMENNNKRSWKTFLLEVFSNFKCTLLPKLSWALWRLTQCFLTVIFYRHDLWSLSGNHVPGSCFGTGTLISVCVWAWVRRVHERGRGVLLVNT